MLNIVSAVSGFLSALGCAVSSGMSILDLWNAGSAPAIPPAALGLAASGTPVIPFCIEKTFADAATGDTAIYNAAAPYAFRVIGFEVENHGANGVNANSVQLCAAAAGASPISDAVSTNGLADQALARATTIDYTVGAIALAGSLYLRRTRAGGVLSGVARIWCVRTA